MNPYGFSRDSNGAPSIHSSNSASVHTSTTVCVRFACVGAGFKPARPPGRGPYSISASSFPRTYREATRQSRDASSPHGQTNSPCTSGAEIRTRFSAASQVTLYAASPSTEQSISLSNSSWSRLFASWISLSARSARRARAAASADPSSGSTTNESPAIVYEAVFSITVFA
jgi:hypothetical protein